MRLAQIVDDNDKRALVVTARGDSRLVKGLRTMRDLATEALAEGAPLRKIIADRGVGKPVNLAAALKEKRVLIPLDHDDPAHVHVTGAGLTHLGSAEGRDKMHRTLADATTLTDSMKMFKLGLDGGKPPPGATGVQPEWFYKGDGSTLVAARRRPRQPELRARRRRGAGDRRPLCHRRRRPAGSPRLRARQRVLRPCHGAAELSLSRPFEAEAGERRPRAAGRRSPRRRARRLAHPPRQGDRVGEAVRLRRTQHVARDRQSRGAPFQIRASSASRATSTSISSARRRCPSPTASAPRRATCSRSSPSPSACRCATG